MPLYRRKGTPHWWVRGSIAGQPYKCTSGTREKAKAEEFEQALRERIWRQRKLGDRSAVSFREAAKRWLRTLTNRTRKQDAQNIAWFLAVPHLAERSIGEIDLEVIEELRALLVEDGRSQSTANRYLAVLRRLLRKCALEWRYIESVPKVPMVTARPAEARWLTPREFGRLRSKLPPHLAIAADFAVHTGLRMRAQLSLRWSQVNLEQRRAWIAAEFMKAGKTHAFPLTSRAVIALREAKRFQAAQDAEHRRWCARKGKRYRARETDHVFTWRRKPIDDCNTLAYQDALRAAGIKDANWHTLRHTFASWAVQGGTTLQELMKLGPWESYDMVLRYAHLARDNLARAAARVDQFENSALRQGNRRRA